MIIDVHTHVGNSDVPGASILQKDCTAELLLKYMEQAEISKAVIFPTSYLDYRNGNEVIYHAVQKYPDRFIGFARFDPKHKNAIATLETAIGELELKGLKIVPRGTDFENPLLHEALDKCAEYDIPVIACCYTVAKEEIEMAQAHPETKIILAHMGAYIDWAAHKLCIRAAKELPNVYLETSNVLTQVTLKEAGNEVPDRVLFGSDAPALNPKAELEKIKAMNFSSETERKILFGNAAKLLKISSD